MQDSSPQKLIMGDLPADEGRSVVVAHPEDIERCGDSPAFVFCQALDEGKVIYIA